MLYGCDEAGARVLATKGAAAVCAKCGGTLVAKCGTIRVWHWAHARGPECDPWGESEGEWHLAWKRLVRPEVCEVVRGAHRADICRPDGVVIELQASPLPGEVVLERERCYGRMVWVFDASAFVDNIDYRERDGYVSFRWRWPRPSQALATCPVFWDFGDGYMFRVRKLYAEPGEPCGGWGLFSTKREFLASFLASCLVAPLPPAPPHATATEWQLARRALADCGSAGDLARAVARAIVFSSEEYGRVLAVARYLARRDSLRAAG
jgi:hypothetical protein